MRIRYSIKWLLAITLIVAVAIFIFQSIPSPLIQVVTARGGKIFINNREVQLEDFKQQFQKEISLREQWFITPSVVVQASPFERMENLMDIVEIIGNRLEGCSSGD